MKFFGELFDAPAEIVIAYGRVVLVALSLAAIAIDPTEPREFAWAVEQTLALYALYSVAVLAALHWMWFPNLNARLIHTVDLVAVALLLVLTEGFSSPFLVFFTFVLLAASLRWDWQGIAITMTLLVLIAGVVAAVEFNYDRPIATTNQSLIRAAYLVAMGTILAYASAHREHERGRLTKLALWPGPIPVDNQRVSLGEALQQGAAVLEASRAVVVWEEPGGKSMVALWQGSECQIIENPSGAPLIGVAPEVEHLAFSRTAPAADRINLINGSVRSAQNALRGELVSRLRIADFVTAPFQGLAAKGRLFVLGNVRPSDDHLPVTRIIADRVGAELDRQIFLGRMAQGAAMRERAAIMRDLHDGLLQNLTAARIHLECLPAGGEQAKDQLQSVRELLRVEQRRVREFVDATHSTDNEAVALGALRPLAEETARLWGCTIFANIEPESATISRRTANQLSLMLAEAVANAVRHGEAKHVQVDVACRDSWLAIEVRDDGHGFPNHASGDSPLEIGEANLPRSLKARIEQLAGRMSGCTSLAGSVLRFELPS